jgi:tetratricopeptide (TPR) repeat protein
MQYYGQAMAHGLSGNQARALALDMQAIELDPNDYELIAGISIRWTMLGDLEQADLWAQKADKMSAEQPLPILARLELYLFREQYSLAADLSKRALDRNLDGRQGSNRTFRNVWIGSLVNAGKYAEALDYYRKVLPGAFESPPVIDVEANRHVDRLVEIATILQMQDPSAQQALTLVDIAEQIAQMVESKWIPWATAVRMAGIATARGDKTTAIAYLQERPGQKFGNRWRDYLTNSFVLEPLHDEPEYQKLIAMLEEDMARQREESYELLGMTK